MGQFDAFENPVAFLEYLQLAYHSEAFAGAYNQTVLDRIFSERRASYQSDALKTQASWSALHPIIKSTLEGSDVQQRIRGNKSSLPNVIYSRYEEPGLVIVIDAARSGLEPFFERVKVSKKISRSDIVIGSLPDATYNAAAIKVPGTERYIVVINTGLFQLLKRVSRIITRVSALFPSSIRFDLHQSDWRDKYQEEVRQVLQGPKGTALLEAFSATILSYCGVEHDLNFDAFEEINKDDITRVLNGEYAIGAEYFVLAHEYCHILYGHFDEGDSTIQQALPDGRRIEVSKLQHKNEFMADVIAGSAVTMAAFKNFEHIDHSEGIRLTNHRLLGPLFFFLCGRTVELADRFFSKKRVISDTHPSLVKRSQLVMAQLHSHNFPLVAEMAEMLTITFENLVRESWLYCAANVRAEQNQPHSGK